MERERPRAPRTEPPHNSSLEYMSCMYPGNSYEAARIDSLEERKMRSERADAYIGAHISVEASKIAGKGAG